MSVYTAKMKKEKGYTRSRKNKLDSDENKRF